MIERVRPAINGQILPPIDSPARSPAPALHKRGFQPGNKLAVGSGGPYKNGRQFLTQTLVSQLHELDANSSREKFHLLVDRLIRNALGYKVIERIKDKSGVVVRIVEHDIPPDQKAIEYIFDRLEGRPTSTLGLDEGTGGRVTVIFETVDKKL